MATATAHFDLTKAGSNENYNVGLVNSNLDIIDQQMYLNQQSAAKVMVGATSSTDGESGRVPPPSAGDEDKYLKADGTWDTPSGGGGGSTVSITPTIQTGTKIADFSINGTPGSLYAPNVDITSLDFTQLTPQQIYDLKSALGILDVELYDYAVFDGTGYMTTPFNINSDYTVEVTFDATYVSPSSVYGNLSSPSYSHLTMYSNNWYMSDGSSEVQPVSYTSGKHTFTSNDNGSNLMDSVVVSSYTPTSQSIPYVIGNRVSSGYYEGKLYEFKLTSISTGDIVYNLLPAKKGNRLGLYDMISDTFTECSYISSVANDV